MKTLSQFKINQLTAIESNQLKGGASDAAKAKAMNFCEWYVSLGAKGTNSPWLTRLNAWAETIVNS